MGYKQKKIVTSAYENCHNYLIHSPKEIAVFICRNAYFANRMRLKRLKVNSRSVFQ